MKPFLSLLIETIGGDKCYYSCQLTVIGFQLTGFDAAIHLFVESFKLI